MATKLDSKTMTVEPGSELDALLNEAATTVIYLDRNGERYRVIRDDEDIWAGYDPEVARAGIRDGAGSWKGLIDADEFKAYIRERRRTKNRPPVRW